jgi:hypothetical protein
MHARWLQLLSVAAASCGAVEGAEITGSPPQSGNAIERGIVGVRCTTDDEGLFVTSRATILDVGAAARADVLLMTAHGLPPDVAAAKRRCRVLVPGKALRIADVVHAGADILGHEHDWAVVVLERRIAGPVHRWRPAQTTAAWLAKAAAAGAPVRLVLRHDDAEQDDCRLEQAAQGMLLGHSCIAHPGMSGSPLVAEVDFGDVPVLLAIHIGTEMRWQGTKLDFVRVARPIDAEVAAAITAAAHGITVLASSETRRAARRTAEARGLGQKQ